MDEEKIKRLQDLAGHERDSQNNNATLNESENSHGSLKKHRNKRRKHRQMIRIGIIAGIVIVAVLVIVGIIFAVSHFTNGHDSTEAETVSTEDEENSPTDSESGIDYDITYESCEIGEKNEVNGYYYPHILVQIKNTTDSNIYLENASYEFVNKDGETVGIVNSSYMRNLTPQIIEPGEYGYFYSDNLLTGDFLDEDDTTFEPKFVMQKTQENAVFYDIENDNAEYDKNTEALVVSGEITNNTDENESNCVISFVFFDKSEKPLGVETVEIGGLASGETQSFEESLLFLEYAEDVKSWDVYSFPYVENL